MSLWENDTWIEFWMMRKSQPQQDVGEDIPGRKKTFESRSWAEANTLGLVNTLQGTGGRPMRPEGCQYGTEWWGGGLGGKSWER